MTQRVTIRLITIGRRSGATRTVTLYAFTDQESLVVVGSRGGAARHPDWVHNLRAEPRAIVARGRAEEAVVAREAAEGVERERLWKLVTDAFPLYVAYQRRTSRRIPLFVLEPAREAT